ncbi:uncharacterized protein LOC130641253 isoform X1 [Hydractinia symbiolongicarpus]|uniref:uncharacterized protein LOC130641253 isoform X1 n=1 Tax=Hydractinia symbiolongicarpus TaxID=13093 RepID=UPI00254A6252|nr:uncharacterized protein LOC130641253 isoform X1 [Hydractinia symbiolongicarpus]
MTESASESSYITASSVNQIRKLRKKLRQIDKLKRLQRELSSEEMEKIKTKDSLRCELHELLEGQEQAMVALTEKVQDTSVVDEGATRKVNALVEFDHKNLNDEVNAANSENCRYDNEKTEINGVHDLKTDEEREKDNADQEDKIKSYQSTPTETTVKVDTALTITRKSLRERKPKSSVESAKTKPGNPSITEQLFQDLNLKVGLLEGHHDDACAVDLCGNFVVSGSRDTSLKLWIASSREELKSLGGHDAAITGVCFMRDKPFSTYPNAVTASYDCSLRVWDLEKGETMKSIYVYSPVLCLDYSAGVVAIGTEGGKVELYNVESSQQLFTVRAHEDAVSAVKILSDRKIASGSSDGIIKIHDPKVGDAAIFVLDLATIKIKQESKENVAATPLLNTSKINCITSWNDYVIYGDDGFNVKVLDYQKGEVIKLRNNLNEYCPTEALSIGEVQGRPFLFSVGSDVDKGDGYINVRSLPDFQYLGTIRDTKENSGSITTFRVEEVDSKLCFVTGGMQLRVWDQARRAKKRKGSSEDNSLIPCKFICSYTECKESEPESESDSESQTSSKEASVISEQARQSYCVIL